jgi:hypothetical protein
MTSHIKHFSALSTLGASGMIASEQLSGRMRHDCRSTNLVYYGPGADVEQAVGKLDVLE